MTTTALAKRNSAVLTKAQREVSVYDHYTKQELGIIKETVAVGATDLELAWFLGTCRSVNLDPLRKQVYFIKRKVKRDGKYVQVPTFQTGIDGFRAIAHRSGVYAGADEYLFNDGLTQYQTIAAGSKIPTTATVTVYKIVRGLRVAFTGVAGWDEYHQDTYMWKGMAFNQLGKCAEAQALRKAFPEDLGGFYTDDEMEQADREIIPDIIEAPPKKESRSKSVTEKLKLKKNSKPEEVEDAVVVKETLQHELSPEEEKQVRGKKPPPPSEDGFLPTDQVRELNISAAGACLKDPHRIPAIVRIAGRSIASTKELLPEDYAVVMPVLLTGRKLANRSKKKTGAVWEFLAKGSETITSDLLIETFKDQDAQTNADQEGDSAS